MQAGEGNHQQQVAQHGTSQSARLAALGMDYAQAQQALARTLAEPKGVRNQQIAYAYGDGDRPFELGDQDCQAQVNQFGNYAMTVGCPGALPIDGLIVGQRGQGV